MLNIIFVTIVAILIVAVVYEPKKNSVGYIVRFPDISEHEVIKLKSIEAAGKKIDEAFAGKDFGTEDFNCHTAGTIIDEAFYDGMKKPVDLPVDFIFPILRENEAYAKEVPDFDGYFDEIGGYHSGGTGTSPNREECGECSHMTCKGCAVWEKH